MNHPFKSSTFDTDLLVVAVKSLQSCLTLCDPINGSPPGSLSLGLSRQEHWSSFYQIKQLITPLDLII